MTRRDLFKRVAGGVAAAIVAPGLVPEAAPIARVGNASFVQNFVATPFNTGEVFPRNYDVDVWTPVDPIEFGNAAYNSFVAREKG